MVATTGKRKMIEEKEIQKIEENGFLLKRRVIAPHACEKIVEYLETKESKINIPFSDVPWGYGDLLGDKTLKYIYENEDVLRVCRHKLGDDFQFNHLMINNKAPWIGPSVEWHQERFNIDTYAPGMRNEPDGWKNFLQVYVALDCHTLENGCLRIIPNSHKEGILEHEDIVNSTLGHKRRVTSKEMSRIHTKYGILNVIMSKGDVLFFNHGLVHGSSANVSHLPRKSVVMQARVPFEKDNKLFNKETTYRRNFVKDTFTRKIEDINKKNIYNDFKRGKSED